MRISRPIQVQVQVQVALLLSLFLLQAPGSEGWDFSGGTCAADCNSPGGYFCGKDGQCHEFRCESFYEFGDPNLTGYNESRPIRCFGYSTGSRDDMHGVQFGCSPVFPGAAITSGQSFSYPFNRICEAEGDGFQFTCYDYQDDSTATSFVAFEQIIQSAFPSCEAGGGGQLFHPVFLNARYQDKPDGLEGNPVVSSGTDKNGKTILQENAARDKNGLDEDLAKRTMYAISILGPQPSGQQSGPTLEPFTPGDVNYNPVHNQDSQDNNSAAAKHYHHHHATTIKAAIVTAAAMAFVTMAMATMII